MDAKKIRWGKTYEAGESELISFLEEKNITAERWVAKEFEEFKPHVHSEDMRVWCADGSITFTVNDKPYPLQAGDALDIPANTFHEAIAGFAGSTCYE